MTSPGAIADHLGDALAGISILIATATAWIMWRQRKDAKDDYSDRVKFETSELLRVQLNIVNQRLDTCETHHKECEERFEKLQRENFDLMRYLFGSSERKIPS